MIRCLALLACTCFCLGLSSQQTKRVLFLGNSYTTSNGLAVLVANIAQSKGDTLIYDSNTPGGYTLTGHSTNLISQDKIAEGTWDYVVLQEQSQLPSLPDSIFIPNSLNSSLSLASQIRAANANTIPMFFMTWGRKNGDASNCPWWPQVCTYSGMQSILRSNYLEMADTNNAEVAPVGAVWRDVRSSAGNIELYAGDGSHPSLAGSYLAACTFYTSIFHKSAAGGFVPQSMSMTDAAIIQDQAFQTVFDSLSVWMINTSIGTQEQLALNLAVFPNPASDRLRVEVSGMSYRLFEYEVYSLDGTRVLVGVSYTDLDISNLALGPYIVKAQIDDRVLITPILKE